MPKKILIIDDDPIVVKYLEAVFSDNGYETCNASSTMEGLDVVKKEKPDLITLDLQMPESLQSFLAGYDARGFVNIPLRAAERVGPAVGDADTHGAPALVRYRPGEDLEILGSEAALVVGADRPIAPELLDRDREERR